MIYYADTSWWLAHKLRNDEHHGAAWSLFDHDEDAKVLWTPWQRVEVFNGLIQLERLEKIDPGEAKEAIRLLEDEVRLGYWTHHEFSWTDAVRNAVVLSHDFGPTTEIRGMDLFHVAIALEIGVDDFLTFDNSQRKLARSVGYAVGKS